MGKRWSATRQIYVVANILFAVANKISPTAARPFRLVAKHGSALTKAEKAGAVQSFRKAAFVTHWGVSWNLLGEELEKLAQLAKSFLASLAD